MIPFIWKESHMLQLKILELIKISNLLGE